MRAWRWRLAWHGALLARDEGRDERRIDGRLRRDASEAREARRRRRRAVSLGRGAVVARAGSNERGDGDSKPRFASEEERRRAAQRKREEKERKARAFLEQAEALAASWDAQDGG